MRPYHVIYDFNARKVEPKPVSILRNCLRVAQQRHRGQALAHDFSRSCQDTLVARLQQKTLSIKPRAASEYKTPPL